MFMMNPSWIPSMFEFTAVRDVINVPLVLQFLILELSIDGLRLAALNTPSMLSTPLSVIAGLVLGIIGTSISGLLLLCLLLLCIAF